MGRPFRALGVILMVESRSETLELLRDFGRVCGEKGWKAAEDGSWVKVGSEYDVIVWSNRFTAPTVKSMVSSRRCSIREDEVWGVKKAKHIAFVATNGFPREVSEFFNENPELASGVTLFDLRKSERRGRLSRVLRDLEQLLQERRGRRFRARSLRARRADQAA